MVMNPDQEETTSPSTNYRGLVFFLAAFLGCCCFIAVMLFALNKSRRRRREFWFRMSRRWPWLKYILEPINPKPTTSVFRNNEVDNLFPRRKHEGEQASCRICLDDINEGESIRQLPCTHVFHTNCIEIWLTRYHAKCAVCGLEIDSQGEMKSPSPPTPSSDPASQSEAGLSRPQPATQLSTPGILTI